MARRAGFDISLEDFDRISRTTPVLANVRPNGDDYLMEDFYNAGGLRALMAQLATSCMASARPSPAVLSLRMLPMRS